jgi:hypothetical protein
MGVDHLDKAAEFFPREDVGNEYRRVFRHYCRKRGCGDVVTAHGVSEEAPQAAQLVEPRLGHWPGFAQKSIYMPNVNTSNAGSRAARTAEGPEKCRIRDE